ncbi:FGL1-like protein [Mya arenaria]|uniref:FGL1-like protein n=1 Tax=Mya arenaria TaxID=6604 RepID=A0ABY7E1E3_MYAAR|nr:FGL1-like protein [Mya arenaria]
MTVSLCKLTDCEAVYASGGMKYLGDYYIMVRPDRSPTPFKVVCKIIEGAGWTVIQRRQDGRENFSRDWEDYKHGFGRLQGEFWLGNDNIHFLTTQEREKPRSQSIAYCIDNYTSIIQFSVAGDYELRVVLEDWEGGRHHAVYDRFRVSGEDQDFRLHVSGYHGDAGDSLTTYYHSHDGMAFSTYDRDNDRRLYDNCAEFYSGGWWFNDCFESHLNGMYYQYGDHDNYFVRNGIQWNTIHRYSSLKFVEMMVKPAKSPKLPNEI